MGYNSIPKQKVAHIYNRFDIKFKIYFFRRQNRQFREESNWATGSTVGGAAKSSKFQIYMPSIVFVGYLLLRYWIVAHTSGLPIVKDGLPIEIRGLPMGYVESNWATGSTVGGAAKSSKFQIYMPSIVFVGYLLLRYWIVAHTSGLPIVKDGLPIEIRGLPMGYAVLHKVERRQFSGIQSKVDIFRFTAVSLDERPPP